VKRQFVDILGAGLAAVSGGRDVTSSRRRRRCSEDTLSSSRSSSRLSDGGHLLGVDRSSPVMTTDATMHRSCAAAALACNTRTRPASDSGKINPHRSARHPTLSGRRRLSENKENIAVGDQRRHPIYSGACKPDIRYPRLFPDLYEDEELAHSRLIRTSSAVREDPQCQATSTTMTLEDVSAISHSSDVDGAELRRVRSTTSVSSSLNGAFCRSSGDAEADEATTAAGAFCSTFSYPLHSTVIDSFFDVSALLPPPSTHAGNSSSQPRPLDDHGSSQNSDRLQRSREDHLYPRLFEDADRRNLQLDDASSRYQVSDVERRCPSTTVEHLSPSAATEMDFARTGDANCTARLRRQMGQTRLYTMNSSSSQRQSDFTCSRLNDCSRSTLFECGCSAEHRFQRLPTASATVDEYSVLPTSSKNFSLSRSGRRYANRLETAGDFTDTCRSWASDGRRRMTMDCPPSATRDAWVTADTGVRHDRYQLIADDQTKFRPVPHRRAADERSDRRQPSTADRRDDVDGGGCPLCGCRRPDAAARRRSRTSKLGSSNCDSTAAERRRKRALVRKLRRFSDAFYGNSGEVRLKTFGHL